MFTKPLIYLITFFYSLVLMNACTHPIKPKGASITIKKSKSSIDLYCISFGYYYMQPSDEDILRKGGHIETTKFSMAEISKFSRKTMDEGKLRRCLIKPRNNNKIFYISQNRKLYDSNFRTIQISSQLKKTILSEVYKTMNIYKKKVLSSKKQNLVDIVATKISYLGTPKSVCIKNGSILTDIADKIIKETNIKSIEEITTNKLVNGLKKLYPCSIKAP